MNFNCDLYCYEDVSGGFTTHVAGNRVVGDVPKEDWRGFVNQTIAVETFTAQHKAQMEFMDTAEREPITLLYAGESFNDPDLESFLERLLKLRAIGYRFPDYVLENVRQEIAETKANNDNSPAV